MIINCYDLLKDEKGFPMLLLTDSESVKVTCSSSVIDFVTNHYKLRSRMDEYVILIALNAALAVKGVFEVSHGGFQEAHCGTKEVFSRLLLVGATGFILVHNHVSGSTVASTADLEVFEKFKKVSKLMEIRLFDFIIVGDDVNSFADRGLVN